MFLKKENFFRGIEPFVLYCVLYLPAVLQQSVGGVLNFDNPFLYVNYFALTIPQFIFLLWVIFKQPQNSFSDFGFRRLDLPMDALMPVVVIASLFAVQIAAALIPRSFGWGAPSPFESTSFLISNGWRLIPAAFMFLLTGYTEELFFRSYLMTYCQRLGIPFWAVLIFSSAIFSLGHLYQGVGVVVIFFIGVVLGLWYHALKNIHLVAWAHGLFNFLQLVILYFSQNW